MNLSSPTPPMPSHHQIRAELETMVLRDLLGPAGGPDETITERTVRDRYLVGVLAPSRRGERGVGSGVNSDSPPATPHTPLDEDESDDHPHIPDGLSEGGSDTADDGATDVDTPVTVAHLPSSFGMTFCVDAGAQSLQVSAHWGQYQRESREEQIDPRTGRPRRVWKRYPRGGDIALPLRAGPILPQPPDTAFPDVHIKG
ncbi:MAG: helicase, partial [Pseudomonadota bacterium]